ncbi:2-C-methyl-D-erythritol 2,4-cyclodiphosphate synthase [Citroniella saccharovorans]|uniref:2-C-methyl-D-erythritol 2,4-cyclodiphosphate synthase n=1 Tax=Citroniella saccharovorans TaxID=2053367 RepID=A0AAW9MV88_9FIRM|nr:2-C-methyl-D-erythritol 2,4-cyclodiphosphate synthase [Citroniella saccharovorans]MEB3429970.1 2-C-methyl-D-erythritol 2,4-cyclodiphosphate synthase [Citroniella saccharovorans]
MRIGNGYDVHEFKEGRKLILGGVEIPYDKGLLGHSDADVLVHAIMDSMLGALALRDIGYQFSDTDNKYKDISSLLLLEKVNSMILKKGYRIENIDSIIACQSPKLKNYIDKMREKISNILEIEIDRVSVKATTTEGLGFVGKKEGIEAYSVCLLKEIGGNYD